MKSLILAVFVLGSIVSMTMPPRTVSSEASTTSVEPIHYTKLDTRPNVSARAYTVFDINTGEVLFSQNSDEPLPIASVTKLFTASAALRSSQLDSQVEVTQDDVAAEGRAGKLEAGQKYVLRDLLFPLLLESSNDAAAVFERTLGKISFPQVQLADASGLSSYNVASASDLAASVSQLYHQQAYLFDITKLPQYIGSETGWVNNSPVRDLPGYQGGKHGYTTAANRTLVAIFSEPTLANREIGYVILGSNDLKADTLSLRELVTNSVRLE
ncbi:D-alanyl-D-alanine carboxypeptidase [Candidatus Nomurabacteria bacterium]|nr:D-alanyl-D-alanine carboxypeptidase [Candidatus Kaiserbacteria bacterium]MCB9814743.1 D-alanyl-D-alanine carboxypeptidase [Candidatus Nomurabacteria bacterium]